MKRILLLTLWGIFLLTGCSARAHELEHSAVVRAIAFDRAPGGYEITAYIAGAEEGSLVSLSADTAAEGLLRLNTETERKISFEKNQVILVSTEIRDLRELLTAVYSSQEAQAEAKIMMVQGKAKDVLSYEGLFRETAADIEKTLENAAENANYPLVTLYGAVNSMAAEAGCCLLPVGKMAGENLILERCTVYRHFRVLQTLNEEQILGCALLREADQAVFSLGENTYALRDLSVKKDRKGEISLRCTYRLLTGRQRVGEGERISAYLQETLRETCALLQEIRADLGQPADPEIRIKAEPAANDYPWEGAWE